MRKSILNLVLLCIICIVAIGIPMPSKTYDFSVKWPSNDKNSSQKEEPLATYALVGAATTLRNPGLVEFSIESKQPLDLTYDNENDLILEIYQEDKFIRSLEAAAFTKDLPKDPNHIEQSLFYTLDLSQETIDLPNGNYQLSIYSTAKELRDISPVRLDISYTLPTTYVSALDSVPKGMMGITLYFPSEKHVQCTDHSHYFIPTTRVVQYNKASISTIIKHLQNGPVTSTGLLKYPFPEVKNIQLKKGSLTLNLTGDLEKFHEDPDLSYFVPTSFAKTLTPIIGVNSLSFLVNGKVSDKLFYGIDGDAYYVKDTNPQVYLGIETTDERTMLFPTRLLNIEKQGTIQEIFLGLKTGEVNQEKLLHTIAPVPMNVELLNYHLEKNTLTLNFNQAFLSVYPEREDLQKMMLEALLYSFTSINGIEKIKLLVDDQPITIFANIDTTDFLKKPLYINPETP